MAKTMFTLWRTKAGHVLITTERQMPADDVQYVTQAFDSWSKGREGAVLMIPDCTYAGELDDEGMVLSVAKSGTAFAFEPQATEVGGKSVPSRLPEDAVGFSADGLVGLVGDRALSPGEVTSETGWDVADVLKAMRTDSRFEEVGPGAGRWQLTNEAAPKP